MNEQNDEQIEQSAHTEASEQLKGASDKTVSLGKFKDVNALLDAYNSLQSEFTKRCQRLKELEGKLEVDKVNAPTEEKDVGVTPSAVLSEEDKNEILKDYVKSVMGLKQSAVIFTGAGLGVKTPADKPKSISEAGVLAKEILQK